LAGRSTIKKLGEVLYESRYSCSLPYSELRSHYDKELSRAGWLFCREEVVRDWGTPVGTEAKYRKEEYEATLFYTTRHEEFGMDFSLSIGWDGHQTFNPRECEPETSNPAGFFLSRRVDSASLKHEVFCQRHGRNGSLRP
jgi:hypothetical protein